MSNTRRIRPIHNVIRQTENSTGIARFETSENGNGRPVGRIDKLRLICEKRNGNHQRCNLRHSEWWNPDAGRRGRFQNLITELYCIFSSFHFILNNPLRVVPMTVISGQTALNR
jgi:hypothetical protein